MTFISGVFFSVNAMPGFLEAIADVLPLTYLLELVREPVHRRGDDRLVAERRSVVVFAWGAVGVVVALRKFRWEPRER